MHLGAQQLPRRQVLHPLHGRLSSTLPRHTSLQVAGFTDIAHISTVRTPFASHFFPPTHPVPIYPKFPSDTITTINGTPLPLSTTFQYMSPIQCNEDNFDFFFHYHHAHCMYKCRQESHQLLFHCITITNADKNHVCLFVCSKGIPTTSPLHYCSGTTTGIQLTTLQHPFTAIFSSRSGRND